MPSDEYFQRSIKDELAKQVNRKAVGLTQVKWVGYIFTSPLSSDYQYLMNFIPYSLELKKAPLGINREDFIGPFHALISSSSVYDEIKIFELMKHNPKENDYLYEDEYIILYDATMPTSKSSSYVKIKPIKVLEDKLTELSLSMEIKEETNINSICFQLKKKEDNIIFQGVFITTSCIEEIFRRKSQENKLGVDFIVPQYFIFLKTISSEQINLAFQKLSKWNKNKLEKKLCKVQVF